MGEDPGRKGLMETPERVAQSLAALTDQGGADLAALLERDVFQEKDAGLVLIRNVEFYSLCEHHLLPFFGRCHVAYLPGKHLVGFSRVPRLVDHFARRLQVQERLTRQVAEALEKAVKPRGVACIVEGFHLCMAMRGVRKQQAEAVTCAYRGLFKRDAAQRKEVAGLLRPTAAAPR
ncbi:MAG: GTP cyclohydrolase I FolE [Terriglobia bacterium]